MKKETKTDKPETKDYPLTEKQFTDFARAIVAIPKKELDKELARDQKHKAKQTHTSHR